MARLFVYKHVTPTTACLKIAQAVAPKAAGGLPAAAAAAAGGCQ